MQIITASEGAVAAHFTTDGAHLLLGFRSGALEMREIASGKLAKTWAPPAGMRPPFALHRPENLYAAVSEEKTIRVYHPGDSTLVAETPAASERPSRLSFSPNGRFLAAAFTQQRLVRLYNLKTGQPSGEFPGGVGGNSALVVSPDHRWLAIGAYDVSFALYNLAAMKLAHSYDNLAMAVFCAAFQGDSIYAGTADGKLYRFRNGKSELLAQNLSSNLNHLIFTPAGGLVSTESDPKSTSRPTVLRSWLPQRAELAQLPRTPTSLVLHHGDARSVAIADGTPDVRIVSIV